MSFLAQCFDGKLCLLALNAAVEHTNNENALSDLKAFKDALETAYKRNYTNTMGEDCSFNKWTAYTKQVYKAWLAEQEEKTQLAELAKKAKAIARAIRNRDTTVGANDPKNILATKKIDLAKEPGGGERKRKRVEDWCAEIEELANMAKKLKEMV